MRELVPGPRLRALVGVVGAAAFLAGAVVSATELWIAMSAWPNWTAAAAAAAGALVTYGGAHLLHGAWRGRLAVRRTGQRCAPREHP